MSSRRSCAIHLATPGSPANPPASPACGGRRERRAEPRWVRPRRGRARCGHARDDQLARSGPAAVRARATPPRTPGCGRGGVRRSPWRRARPPTGRALGARDARPAVHVVDLADEPLVQPVRHDPGRPAGQLLPPPLIVFSAHRHSFSCRSGRRVRPGRRPGCPTRSTSRRSSSRRPSRAGTARAGGS
jgi:hypothetical protein